MSKYKIEKGIPIRPKPYSKYPFEQMEVGDSFKIPREEALALRKIAHYLGKKYGFKLSIRKVAKDDFRVWRVA